MPYKRLGKEIHTKRTGTWTRKQTCKNIPNAKSALRLLNQIEANKIIYVMNLLKAEYPNRRNLIHNYQTKILANPLEQQHLTSQLILKLRVKPTNTIKFSKSKKYILTHTGKGVRRYKKRTTKTKPKHSKAYKEAMTLYKKKR